MIIMIFKISIIFLGGHIMNLNSKLLNILGVDRHFSAIHLEF